MSGSVIFLFSVRPLIPAGARYLLISAPFQGAGCIGLELLFTPTLHTILFDVRHRVNTTNV